MSKRKNIRHSFIIIYLNIGDAIVFSIFIAMLILQRNSIYTVLASILTIILELINVLIIYIKNTSLTKYRIALWLKYKAPLLMYVPVLFLSYRYCMNNIQQFISSQLVISILYVLFLILFNLHFAIPFYIGVQIVITSYTVTSIFIPNLSSQNLMSILSSGISLLTFGAFEIGKFISQTSTLSLNKKRPLDMETFEKTYRVSAMITNEGRIGVKDVKAVLTLKINNNTDLSCCLVKCDQCPVRDKCDIKKYLVNRDNPHVDGELLAWAVPEKPVSRHNTDLVYITSISPNQRARLLLFEIRKVESDQQKGVKGRYIVSFFSEYGAHGPNDKSDRPYRACLEVSKEIDAEVVVSGEGAREPLRFMLRINAEKLDKVIAQPSEVDELLV